MQITAAGARVMRVLGAAFIALTLAISTAGWAVGQQQPTTSGPPGTEPPTNVTCPVSGATGVIGELITVHVTGALVGTEVEILLNGEVVAEGVVPEPDGQASDVGSIDLSFRLEALAPGTYPIVAVGVNFTITCGSVTISARPTTTSRGGGGSLGVTGFEVLMYVLAALSLIVVGRLLLNESRRRRKARRGEAEGRLEHGLRSPVSH